MENGPNLVELHDLAETARRSFFFRAKSISFSPQLHVPLFRKTGRQKDRPALRTVASSAPSRSLSALWPTIIARCRKRFIKRHINDFTRHHNRRDVRICLLFIWLQRASLLPATENKVGEGEETCKATVNTGSRNLFHKVLHSPTQRQEL